MLNVWRLFGEENHDAQRQQHHDGGEAIDMLPAKVCREPRSKEGGYRRSAVARSGNAHGETLVFRGEPTGAEREGYAEAGSSNAQQNAHGEHVVDRS